MQLNSNFLNLKIIIRATVIYAIFVFLFVVFFGLKQSPTWYSFVLYFFEELSFFCAGFFCIRNWLYPRLISDRRIWLILGTGLACQGIGNIIYGYWELVFKRDPALGISNIFYIIAYVSMVSAIFLAFRYRAINLSIWQWGIVGFASTIAISLAIITNTPPHQNAYFQTDFPSNLLIENKVDIVNSSPPFSPINYNLQLVADIKPENNAPGWIIATDKMTESIIGILNKFYVIADVLMLIMASMLLVTFWGGKFSQTWLAISSGALWFYIADIWYTYVYTYTGVTPRGLLDCFWAFSALCYLLGAALEYDISVNLRRRNQESN